MARKRNVILYLFSVILIIVYVCLFINGLLKRSVCEEYEMYYVNQTLKDWPGYGGLSYTLGTVENFYYAEPMIKRRGDGWGTFTENGCYMTGEYAFLYYRGLPEDDIQLEITTDGDIFSTPVVVFANEHEIGTIAYDENNSVYEFSIPGAYMEKGSLNLSFAPEPFTGTQNYLKVYQMKLDIAKE